jgi:hypothetical protein
MDECTDRDMNIILPAFSEINITLDIIIEVSNIDPIQLLKSIGLTKRVLLLKLLVYVAK